MNPWSLRCSKLALGKTNKISVCLTNSYSGCRTVHGQGKSQREITFFKARELSGVFDSVREFFNLSQNQEILKNEFINCQTTMNTNILSPIACPY